LSCDAVSIDGALVATLSIDPAELCRGTLAVRAARLLVGELTDVVGAIARDASLGGRTIAAAGASVVATLEGADERRVAVGIDGAALVEPGEWVSTGRRAARGDHEDTQHTDRATEAYEAHPRAPFGSAA
jgi:hypothetical protein